MREAHDRQGTRRNIRVISIEVRQHNIFEDTVDLVDFEGTVEACYTPVDYVEGDDVEDANE